MILLNIFSALLLSLHPFHVSVMNIDHAADENSLQITLKLFADDLEEALNNPQFRAADEAFIDVLNPKDQQRLNSFVEEYLQKHLTIEVNGKKVKPNFLGKEMEGMAMWTYLEVPEVSSVASIKVRNSLLTEIFDDQINLVHVKYQNTTKSMKLAGNQLLDEVSFID
ncbi:MAG: DUF6702 family protein [bacterium]